MRTALGAVLGLIVGGGLALVIVHAANITNGAADFFVGAVCGFGLSQVGLILGSLWNDAHEDRRWREFYAKRYGDMP